MNCLIHYLKFVFFYTTVITIALATFITFLTIHIGVIVYAFYGNTLLDIPVAIASAMSAIYCILSLVNNLDRVNTVMTNFLMEE